MLDAYTVFGPLLRSLDPETAHRLTIQALKTLPLPFLAPGPEPMLESRRWGLSFPHPLGIAAGFDKDAEVIAPLLRLGFGSVETGTVTPRPQPGNPRPRAFRLPELQALINRYGFNNQGLAATAGRLGAWRELVRRGRAPAGVVGANLGRNKDSRDAVADYVAGVEALGPLADYLVLNVSSPNTPGLRTLQNRQPLTELLGRVLEARARLKLDRAPPPVLLKLAPDLAEEDLATVAEVVLAAGIDGLIVSNTTLERPPGLPLTLASQPGGLSGPPLFQRSTAVLAALYRLTGGRLPLIGCGGISDAASAYAKIRAGASLLQLYTALIYQGPGLLGEITRGLVERLAADGFSHLDQAVGADHRPLPESRP